MSQNKFSPSIEVVTIAGIFGMGIAGVGIILFIMSLIGQIVFPFAPIVFILTSLVGVAMVKGAFHFA